MDEAGLMNEVEDWAEKNGGFKRHRFFRTSGSSGKEKWVALSDEALECLETITMNKCTHF